MKMLNASIKVYSKANMDVVRHIALNWLKAEKTAKVGQVYYTCDVIYRYIYNFIFKFY